MPIIKNGDNEIEYTEPRNKQRSDATGTVVDDEFAIIDQTNVVKQIKFNIIPTDNNPGVLTLNCSVGADATLDLTSGGGGAAWGAITGTLSAQTDLQGELDNKLDLAGDTMSGDLHLADGIEIHFDASADGIITSDANLQLSPAGDLNILPATNAFIATTSGDINLQAVQSGGSAAATALTATSTGQADVSSLVVQAENGGESFVKGAINDATFQAKRITSSNRLVEMVVGPSQEGQVLIEKTGGSYTALIKSNNTSIAASDAAGVVITTDASGTTITGGNVNVDSNNVINVADPTDPQHAATKAYVDSKIFYIDSASPAGGSSLQTYTFSGLLDTDEILAWGFKTNAAHQFIEQWTNHVTGSIDFRLSGDPGASSVIRITVKR